MLPPDVLRRAERRIGTTLCRRWHIDSVIGAGALGTVYAATHRNRRRVAIKVLHPEVSVDESIRSRLMRDCYIASVIDHPGVVEVIDDDEAEDGSAFLVMELLSGESVGHRMEQHGGRLPLPEALWIADQVLDVLAAAQAQGIVHGDIKPNNLFVTSTGCLKVFDFGIAQLSASVSGATRAGLSLGTPGYASPEQARARSDEVDGRSDVYSVGATLFSMVAGRPVHRAESSTEALALTISMRASSVAQVEPNLPAGVIELIDKALRYRREDRWRDARSMQEATRRASGGLPNLVREEPAADHLQRIEVAPQPVTRMEPLPQPTTMGSLGAGRRRGLVARITRLRLRSKVGGLIVAALAIAAGTLLTLRLSAKHAVPGVQPSVPAGADSASPVKRRAARSPSAVHPSPPAVASTAPAHLSELRAARTTPSRGQATTTSSRAAPSTVSHDSSEPGTFAPPNP
jgi:serine/threonine-protein kinase